jgi:hypothetical protein
MFGVSHTFQYAIKGQVVGLNDGIEAIITKTLQRLSVFL